MTWSVEDRTANARLALTMFADAVGDKPINQVVLESGDHRYREILRTTWTDLHARDLRSNVSGTDMYFLTGEGWYRGLDVSGQLEDAQFQQKLGALSATFKRYIKERDREEVTLVNDASEDSGLPSGFIYNVVESRAIQRAFNVVGPE